LRLVRFVAGGAQKVEHTLQTAENVAVVGKMISSQEDQPATHKALGEISRVTGSYRRSMQSLKHFVG